MSGLRSIRNLSDYPAGRPLGADDLIEFHASRLLLLLQVSGGGEIEGLTKLAKLDFFVRYPSFFARACVRLKKPIPQHVGGIEAEMVRHHYGPWDHRYYQVLAYLEARRLITVSKAGRNAYVFRLTDLGRERASVLSEAEAFGALRDHMARVKAVLGSKSGSALKNLIYELFEREITSRPMGARIR